MLNAGRDKGGVVFCRGPDCQVPILIQNFYTSSIDRMDGGGGWEVRGGGLRAQKIVQII